MNPTSNIAPPGQADAIRAWARAQGMEVKQAGRLPAAVIQTYRESFHG
jgi:Lsr2 protein